MTISELEEHLKKIRDTHGDIEVAVHDIESGVNLLVKGNALRVMQRDNKEFLLVVRADYADAIYGYLFQ